MLKIDVQGGEQSVLNGAKALIQSRRIQYIYFEVASHSLAVSSLRFLEDAGYMCYDHAGLWMHEREPFRPASFAADAVPGDRLVLSNGLKWREYWAKTRPSDIMGYKSMYSSGMAQTDFMCMPTTLILDE